MGSFTKKLVDILPILPRRRNHIFSGSNTWSEWKMMVSQLFAKNNLDEISVIESYEKEFANKVNTEFAFSFGAGRMGLYAILEALDIKEGDEVIIPAYTCVVVPNAILYRKATPIYIDIDPQTLNIDVSLIEKSISPRTKAILAQHTFGMPCEFSSIRSIADRHGLLVIEDCAHALGAKYEEKPVGSLGDVAFFSTDHSKITSTFIGGMITTSNFEIAERIKRIQLESEFLPIKQHRKVLLGFISEFPLFSGRFYWFGKFVMAVLNRLGLVFFWRDEQMLNKPNHYPYPARLSSAQAILGLSQLSMLDENIKHRRSICRLMEQSLGFRYGTYDNSACLRYSFYASDRQEFEYRFSFHWDLGVWFTSVVHGKNDDWHDVCYTKGSCPHAEYAARHLVNFPTHQRISLRVVERIIKRNETWLRNNCW